MRPALLALLLSGCASGPCLFGAERAEDARACAVRNFGAKAAEEMYQRTQFCEAICDGVAAPECAVNCP